VREAIAVLTSTRRCGTTAIGVCIDFLEAFFFDTKPPVAYLSAPYLELQMKLIGFVSPFLFLVSLDVLILTAYSLLSFPRARTERHFETSSVETS